MANQDREPRNKGFRFDTNEMGPVNPQRDAERPTRAQNMIKTQLALFTEAAQIFIKMDEKNIDEINELVFNDETRFARLLRAKPLEDSEFRRSFDILSQMVLSNPNITDDDRAEWTRMRKDGGFDKPTIEE